MATSNVAAIILAAGEASRFRAAAGAQGPVTKLVADYRGKALVRHVAEAALAAGLAPVIVVMGHAADAVQDTLADLQVRFVSNPDYASGMGTSLRQGFTALDRTTDAAMVLLGDMPLVDVELISALVAAFADDVTAVVPVYDGQRGNPVVLSTKLAPEIAALTGDAGARNILRERKDVREVPVNNPATRLDIDTPDALANL